MTTYSGQPSTEQREEMFRSLHAEHLQRQTAALETIRGVLLMIVLLAIVGGVISVVVATQL